MIVQCPACASRYRIRDTNIPPSGGKIRCPSCSHSFVVYPENQGAPGPAVDEDRTQLTSDRDLNQLVKKLRSQQGGGMPGAPMPDSIAAGDEPRTEIVKGAELDRIRMMEALKSELGEPGANDGTVEMQNPYANWDNQPAHGDDPDDVTQNEFTSPAGMDFGEPGSLEEATAAGVTPESLRSEAAPPAGPGGPPPLPGGPKRPAPPASTPAQPPVSGAAPQPVVEEEEQPAIDPDHDGPWKLKTNFGLTYEFPDTKSLRGWLNSREELDGYTLSMGGPDFFPLTEFPQLERNRGLRTSQSMPSVGAAGSGPNRAMSSSGIHQNLSASGQFDAASSGSFTPPAGYDDSPAGSGLFDHPAQGAQSAPGPRVTNEYRPPSNAAKGEKIAWFIFFLLVPTAAVVAIQSFGIYDIKGLIFGAEPTPAPTPQVQPIERPAQPDQPTPNPEEAAEAAANTDQEQVAWLLKDARQQVESSRLQSALEKVEKAELLAPASVELLELKAEILDGLGQPEKAEEAREQAKTVAAEAEAEADAAPAEGEDAVEPDGADDAAESP